MFRVMGNIGAFFVGNPEDDVEIGGDFYCSREQPLDAVCGISVPVGPRELAVIVDDRRFAGQEASGPGGQFLGG